MDVFIATLPSATRTLHVFENKHGAGAILNEQMTIANQRQKQKFSEIEALLREMQQAAGN